VNMLSARQSIAAYGRRSGRVFTFEKVSDGLLVRRSC